MGNSRLTHPVNSQVDERRSPRAAAIHFLHRSSFGTAGAGHRHLSALGTERIIAGFAGDAYFASTEARRAAYGCHPVSGSAGTGM